jgi:RNA polymerase sigma factor (sigma-70 family)
LNDADIVRRVHEGDSEAYSQLLQRYGNVIYALAYSHLHNFEDARDVAQEAFIAAYLRLGQLREPAKFGAWLRQITVNQCHMWQRQKRDHEPLDVTLGKAHEAEQVETRVLVHQALLCLSASTRLTLTLFYMHSYSMQEIAEFLEVPVSTVKSRLRNARDRLKKELGEMETVKNTLQDATLPPTFAAQVMEVLDGGTVWSLSFAPDSQTLASASSNKTVKLWDARTGQLLRTLHGHEKSVDQVVYSPDGSTLASASRDHSIKLWDAQSGELKHTLSPGERPISIAFSPDGKLLANASSMRKQVNGQTDIVGSRVLLWNVESGDVVRELERLLLPELHPEPTTRGGRFYSAVFSPDGATVATGAALWEGSQVVGGEVKLWDVLTGELRLTLAVPHYGVQPVEFSPDGRLLAAGCTKAGSGDGADTIEAEMRVWNAASGALVRTLTEEPGWYLKALQFSPDSKTLAVCRMQAEHGNATNCDVRLWDLRSGAPLQTLSGGRKDASVITFSPDGKMLASGGARNDVKLWRVQGL